MSTQQQQTLERREVALRLVVQGLAVLDALAPPLLGMWWVSTLPARGGVVGLVAAMLLGWWGLKKLARAVFALDEYPWFALRVGRWALVLLVIGLVGKVWIALGR